MENNVCSTPSLYVCVCVCVFSPPLIPVHRNPLVPALQLLSSVSAAAQEASCPLHASWFSFMQITLEKLALQVHQAVLFSRRAVMVKSLETT